MAKKNSEKDTLFSQSTIYNSTETFEYVPENDKTFEAFTGAMKIFSAYTVNNGPVKKKVRLQLINWE